MGRTNPTYRDALERYESSWEPFRRALRRDRTADFDRLFDRAHEFAGPSGQQNPADPHRTVVLSVLLSQERELRRLRERVDALERANGEESGDRDEGGAARGDEG
ncbi:hypothetical protein [Halopelagius longus]|uniref:DUF8156 domain-containing protein n=1 Tax=Halopelagius longus TaxID=1236180 RepID=A0A1H0Z773_9EURY|nr:hypothetical protein [Halopelagius longus]RDI72852.1 hypothetical protein DWB78_14580 [Halopelagius longus]SDQ22946.1 hypothetical protein SAMN05216278_1039 [Halopelagius longus]